MIRRLTGVLLVGVGVGAGIISDRILVSVRSVAPVSAGLKPPVLGQATEVPAKGAPTPTVAPPVAARVTLDGLDAAIRAALRPGSYQRRDELLRQLAESIDPSDIPAVLKVLAGRRELLIRYGLTQRLLARWGRIEPAAASAYALALPPSRNRASALEAVLGGWLQQNSAAALKWVGELPPGPERNRLLQAAAGGLGTQDPKQVLEFIRSLKRSERGLEATVLRRWAEVDPAAAAAAASSLTDASTLSGIASSWARTDPAAAVEWVRDLPESARKREATRGLCDSLASTDPALATDLALGLPNPQARGAALAAVASQLADTDLNSAIAWAQQLTDRAGKAAALRRLAYSWAETDPTAAATYALSLEPGSGRDDLVRSVAGVWGANDPQAALR